MMKIERSKKKENRKKEIQNSSCDLATTLEKEILASTYTICSTTHRL